MSVKLQEQKWLFFIQKLKRVTEGTIDHCKLQNGCVYDPKNNEFYSEYENTQKNKF